MTYANKSSKEDLKLIFKPGKDQVLA